jgi:hypothetical protein
MCSLPAGGDLLTLCVCFRCVCVCVPPGSPVAEPVELGAASVVFAALSESLDGTSFAYIKHCRRDEPAPAARNASAAAFLWRESSRLVSASGVPRPPASRHVKGKPSSPSPLPRHTHIHTQRQYGAEYLRSLWGHLLGCLLAYGLASIAFLGPWAQPESGTWLAQHKLDRHATMDGRTLLREALFCLTSVGVLTGWDVVLRVYFGMVAPKGAALPSVLGAAAMGSAAVVIGDSHFYWTHRLLHTVPWLYKHVHRTHHLSTSPGPLSGLSFHPAESLLYFSSLGLVVALVPLHHGKQPVA